MNVNEITTKAKILILFANTYSMVDERGNALSGCSVHYLFWGEGGEKLMEESQWDVSKPVGVQRSKASIDSSLRVKIPIAPALYEGTFALATGGDGKPVLRLQDVAFISPVRIKENHIDGLIVPGMIGTQGAVSTADSSVPPSAADVPESGSGKDSKASNK